MSISIHRTGSAAVHNKKVGRAHVHFRNPSVPDSRGLFSQSFKDSVERGWKAFFAKRGITVSTDHAHHS